MGSLLVNKNFQVESFFFGRANCTSRSTILARNQRFLRFKFKFCRIEFDDHLDDHLTSNSLSNGPAKSDADLEQSDSPVSVWRAGFWKLMTFIFLRRLAPRRRPIN